MHDRTREPRKLLGLIETIQKLDSDGFISLLMKTEDEEKNTDYMWARSWMQTWDEYLSGCLSPNDIYIITSDKDSGYQLWQSSGCSNFFAIVDSVTSRCLTGHGYSVVGHYMTLTNRDDKQELWHEIFDASYLRGEGAFKRYSTHIIIKEEYFHRKDIEDIFAITGMNKHVQKNDKSITPDYITFMVLDEDNQYWYTRSCNQNFDPMLFCRVEFEESDDTMSSD